MSVKIMTDVFDNSEMRGNDRLVMLSIADNADDEKRQAWPSVANISRKTRIPIRTVWRCIKRCVAAGELAIVQSGSKDGGSNLYQIMVQPSAKGGSVKMTGVPHTGIPPMPPVGTLTISEPSGTNTLAKGSLEEVVEFCLAAGLPKSDGEWFFNKCEGNGWKNDGKPIKNWRATIRAWQAAGYMASQKQNKPQTGLPLFERKRTVFELKTIIEAKQKIADNLRRHRGEAACGYNWDSDAARIEYNKTVKEINELNKQLASM